MSATSSVWPASRASALRIVDPDEQDAQHRVELLRDRVGRPGWFLVSLA